MIAILDYGVGNLFSLRSSFGVIGAEAEVTALEGEEESLTAVLADPASGEAERADAGKALKALAEKKAAAEARWEELGQLRDSLAARLAEV